MLIDGHMRRDEHPDSEIPVLVTDLTEDEAQKLLVTLDSIGAAAETDDAALAALLEEIEFEGDAVDNLLADLHGLNTPDDQETELRQLDVKPPPAMVWVLIGIPTVKKESVDADN